MNPGVFFTPNGRLWAVIGVILVLTLACVRSNDFGQTLPSPPATLPATHPQPTSSTPRPGITSTKERRPSPPPPGTAPFEATVTPLTAFLPADLGIITAEDVTDLKQLATIDAKEVLFPFFSPERSKLAAVIYQSADHSGVVKIYDLHSGKERFTLDQWQQIGVPTVSFSPDGGRLATISSLRGDVAIWDSATGQKLRSIAIDSAFAALTPDWQRLLLGVSGAPDSTSTTLKWLDPESNQQLRTQSLDVDLLGGQIVFSPDSQTMAILSQTAVGGIPTSLVTIWDVDTGKKLHSLYNLDKLVFSGDGRLAAALFGPDKLVKLYNTTSWKELRQLGSTADGTAAALAFSPQGELLAVSYGDEVKIWETGSGKELAAYPIQAGGLAFSPDGRLLVSADYQGPLRFWGVTP